uniref:Small auxin up regulated protein n=1 Tax=Kalanchoe fedtschenkoi TaxID=63787 RepID=A0A7N0TMG8_KALFE
MEKPPTILITSSHICKASITDMAKLRVSNPSHGSSMVKKPAATASLKVAMARLQRSLSLTKKSPDESELEQDIPHDVKEGHFAVMAMDCQNRATRFVIPLTCLSHPVFLSFLAQAAEEYGFDRAGALTLPCRAHELERILSDQ